MTDVIPASGKKVVDAKDIVTLMDQVIAEMRTDEARTASDENPQRYPPQRSDEER